MHSPNPCPKATGDQGKHLLAHNQPDELSGFLFDEDARSRRFGRANTSSRFARPFGAFRGGGLLRGRHRETDSSKNAAHVALFRFPRQCRFLLGPLPRHERGQALEGRNLRCLRRFRFRVRDTVFRDGNPVSFGHAKLPNTRDTVYVMPKPGTGRVGSIPTSGASTHNG